MRGLGRWRRNWRSLGLNRFEVERTRKGGIVVDGEIRRYLKEPQGGMGMRIRTVISKVGAKLASMFCSLLFN